MKLRRYQQEAIDSFYSYIKNKKGRRPLLVLPTGSGKSLIIAQIIKNSPDKRFLVVAHVKELVEQNYKELLNLLPNADAGIHCASLQKRDTKNKIIFGSILSIFNKLHEFEKFNCLIIDEAHLVPKEAQTTYIRLIDSLTIINPQLAILGLTATPYRTNDGDLVGDFFDGIACKITVKRLVDEGYLSPIITKSSINSINTDALKITRGEFDNGELCATVQASSAIINVVGEVLGHENRKKIIIFAASIDHARKLADAFNIAGVEAQAIDSETPLKFRNVIIKAFKNSEFKILININILTTGFNVPDVDMIVIVRATTSPSLYVQMVGRGMRISPDKENCLLLDYGHHASRFGLIDDITATKKRKGEGDKNLVKMCKDCRFENKLAAKTCIYCGMLFESKTNPEHYVDAFNGEVVVAKPIDIEVDSVDVVLHEKNGKKMVKVVYWSHVTPYYDWLFLDYSGYPYEKSVKIAKSLHLKYGNVDRCLNSVESLVKPYKIRVKRDGKYFKVINRFFHEL